MVEPRDGITQDRVVWSRKSMPLVIPQAHWNASCIDPSFVVVAVNKEVLPCGVLWTGASELLHVVVCPIYEKLVLGGRDLICFTACCLG